MTFTDLQFWGQFLDLSCSVLQFRWGLVLFPVDLLCVSTVLLLKSLVFFLHACNLQQYIPDMLTLSLLTPDNPPNWFDIWTVYVSAAGCGPSKLPWLCQHHGLWPHVSKPLTLSPPYLKVHLWKAECQHPPQSAGRSTAAHSEQRLPSEHVPSPQVGTSAGQSTTVNNVSSHWWPVVGSLSFFSHTLLINHKTLMHVNVK